MMLVEASTLEMTPVARMTGTKKITRARPRPWNFVFKTLAMNRLKMMMTGISVAKLFMLVMR